MAKVAPFHSVRPSDVYHDRDECPAGQAIAEAERRPGTGNRARCFHCARTTSLENARRIRDRDER